MVGRGGLDMVGRGAGLGQWVMGWPGKSRHSCFLLLPGLPWALSLSPTPS